MGISKIDTRHETNRYPLHSYLTLTQKASDTNPNPNPPEGRELEMPLLFGSPPRRIRLVGLIRLIRPNKPYKRKMIGKCLIIRCFAKGGLLASKTRPFTKQ